MSMVCKIAAPSKKQKFSYLSFRGTILGENGLQKVKFRSTIRNYCPKSILKGLRQKN